MSGEHSVACFSELEVVKASLLDAARSGGRGGSAEKVSGTSGAACTDNDRYCGRVRDVHVCDVAQKATPADWRTLVVLFTWPFASGRCAECLCALLHVFRGGRRCGECCGKEAKAGDCRCGGGSSSGRWGPRPSPQCCCPASRSACDSRATVVWWSCDWSCFATVEICHYVCGG